MMISQVQLIPAHTSVRIRSFRRTLSVALFSLHSSDLSDPHSSSVTTVIIHNIFKQRNYQKYHTVYLLDCTCGVYSFEGTITLSFQIHTQSTTFKNIINRKIINLY